MNVGLMRRGRLVTILRASFVVRPAYQTTCFSPACTAVTVTCFHDDKRVNTSLSHASQPLAPACPALLLSQPCRLNL